MRATSLLRLPSLLLRRDALVRDLPRAGRCGSCGRPSAFVRLVGPGTSGRFATWPYPEDYLVRCATRENWLCVWCRRSFRMRMLGEVVWKYAAGADAYQAGVFTTLTARRAKAFRSFVVSEYVEGAEPGAVVNGVSRQDLQQLTWPDATFDLVITSEVFEHVADPWAAFDEVRRVLRPGGLHVFTVPDIGDEPTRRREGLPTVLHMDGPSSPGIPVVTDFGLDLVERLRAHGFETVVHGFPVEEPVTRVFESVAV